MTMASDRFAVVTPANHVPGPEQGHWTYAPIDVEIAPGDVLQPDVLLLLEAHLHTVKASRIIGTPDLIVEVASPGTATHDRREKYDAYANSGVPEYWITDPIAHTVEVFLLESGKYYSQGVFRGKAILPSQVLPGFDVPVELFFL